MAPWWFVLAVSALGCVAAQSGTQGCPAGLPPQYLRTFMGRCYLFVTYEMRTWSESKTNCNRHGGRLVMVPDQATQDFLAKTLTELHYKKTATWIGLSDSGTEGNWVWDKGENVTYTNWNKGEPGIYASLEDCALLQTNNGFRWGDAVCDFWPQYHSYICQFDGAAGNGTTLPPGITQKQPSASVTYPAFCGDFTCSKTCGASGFKADKDGCPLCVCKDAAAPASP